MGIAHQKRWTVAETNVAAAQSDEKRSRVGGEDPEDAADRAELREYTSAELLEAQKLPATNTPTTKHRFFLEFSLQQKVEITTKQ
jgi:hypothetical protein